MESTESGQTSSFTSHPPPHGLRIAVGLWCALATFVVVQAGLSWNMREQMVTALTGAQDIPAEEATSAVQSLLLLNTAIGVLFALGYAAFGLFQLTRRAWTRIAVTVVAGLHLLLVLSSGVTSPTNMVTLALVVAASVFTWLPSSSAWLASGKR